MSNSARAKARRTKRSHLTKYERREQTGALTRQAILDRNAQRRAALDISFAKLLKTLISLGPFRSRPEDK